LVDEFAEPSGRRGGATADDDEPRHFHAEHQAQDGKFDFDGNQIVGNITSRNALDLIQQWAQANRAALDANWSKIKSGQPLERIPPLE
jgi:hypothetical protein